MGFGAGIYHLQVNANLETLLQEREDAQMRLQDEQQKAQSPLAKPLTMLPWPCCGHNPPAAMQRPYLTHGHAPAISQPRPCSGHVPPMAMQALRMTSILTTYLLVSAPFQWRRFLH